MSTSMTAAAPSSAITQSGWTAGAGVEFAVSGNWSAKLEYEYVDLTRQRYDLSGFGLPGVDVDPRIHLLKFGLNYHFGDTPWNPTPRASRCCRNPTSGMSTRRPRSCRRAIRPFRSPYAGPEQPARRRAGAGDLDHDRIPRHEAVARRRDLFRSRNWRRVLASTARSALPASPTARRRRPARRSRKSRAQRYYFKQTFGLGGEQEDVADAPNQLPGKRDIDRVTLIVGRFAVGDFFDNNAYAHDPRADFMNWAMWASAAYDFPADLPGFTRGAVVELNRKDWAVRAGLFEVPSQPNSDILTIQEPAAPSSNSKSRYDIFDQPGKLRLGAFGNQGNTGNYRQALAIAAADPALDINAVMASIRHANPKYGVYANLEQQIVKDVGLFARASWNDGQNEILSFTDIDRSLSGGLSIKGSFWGRPDDTIGIGGAVNGLSAAHRDFLAAGGLGLLIGDGRLNYSPERIFETYYAYAIDQGRHAHRRLSVHHQSRLQRRSRPGLDLLGPPARASSRRR